MNSKLSLILLLAISAFSGCGGSGGSSTSSGPAPLAPVTITSTNAPTVTAAAFASASLKVNSLSPMGVQTTTSSTDDRILYQLNDFALKKFAEHQNTPMSVTGTVTASASCITGDATSGTLSFISDGTGPSNSTYVTFTFTNCKLSASSTTTVNGTFGITGLAATASTQSATVSINLTITTTGYSTIKYVGGYTLTATGVNTATRNDALTGSSLVFSLGSLNESLSNFSFSSTYNDVTPSSYSDSVSYTISSDFTGGSFTFATITPIVRNYGELYPHSGQVVISGANSSKLRATILATSGSNIAGTSSGQITLEISTDNGTSWTLLSTQTWATL
jgi:hypothetical protein